MTSPSDPPSMTAGTRRRLEALALAVAKAAAALNLAIEDAYHTRTAKEWRQRQTAIARARAEYRDLLGKADAAAWDLQRATNEHYITQALALLRRERSV